MSNKFQRTKVGKITSVFVGLTTTLWLSGAVALMPTVASAQTASDLQVQIDALLAQIATLQAQLASLQGGTGTVCGYTFAVDLKQGSTGTDVKNLQTVLNSDAATQVAASGVGSSGNETTYFGSLTKAAAIKFQDKYSADILTPLGLTAGTGYVGAATRAKLNALYGTCAVTPTTPTTPTTPAVPGTGLAVASATQPTATLAVNGAARVPFTKITLTASADGDVTVNDITVERTGLAHDAVFSNVVLLDEDGNQVGLTRTFNSSHQAKVGEAFVVKAGQSRTMTIAGNMAASLTSYAGEVAYLSVTAIGTSAAVSGTLPITGAGHTINATLAIGSITAERGPLDPNTAITKSVGTTGYTFSSLKITAGSTEKVRLLSIRWNQASSASDSDLDNIKVVVDSVSYDATMSSDGKYYTANFGDGIVIDKGLSSEISIKADIVSGSGRTVAFSVEKTTDIYLKGETYGYGITPPTTGTGITAGNIWFAASTVSIGEGTMTVSQDTSVASQNIAVNLANQPLAGITVKVEGEDITVSQIIFDVATTTGSWYGLLTNISLYDENGAVVAGAVDEASTAAGAAAITFTDSVTFKIGTHKYTVKGKTPSTAGNNGTYRLTTNAATDWTTVKGVTTGNTITPGPSGDQALQTMTVKAATIEISTSGTPAAQNIVAGSQAFTFANIVLDATGSGEDIKFVSIPLNYSTDDTATYLTSCSLYDGTTALNTGSNIINPSAAASSTTFTFDTPLIVTKSTTKTLAVKCNASASATADKTYIWSYASGASATGVTSGQSATVSGDVASGVTSGQKMTVVANGTFTVVIDASSPGYGLATGGSTGNTIGAIKFTAANEAINLDRVHLQLTNTSSSSATDITQVSLWDGTTQVGTALFTGTNTTATATISNFQIPKDGSKKMTVKADFAQIGTGKPITIGGHFIAVDYNGDDTTSTHGTGAQSGASVNTSSSSDTASAGVRIFKSIPTIAKVTLSTGESTLANGSSVTLLKWKVSADAAGDVGVGKFTLTFATTTAVLDSIDVFAYSDSGYTTPVTGLYSGSGDFSPTDIDMQLNWADESTQFDFTATNSSSASTTVQVPAGSSIWFVAKGTVTGTASGASITTTLQGDSAYLLTSGYTNAAFYSGTAADMDNFSTHDDFLWSGNSTQTPAAITDGDWVNGYGVITTESVYDTISK